MEREYPGLWQSWLRNQCVAVGWPPGRGGALDSAGREKQNWRRARAALDRVDSGDLVVVQLRNNRVGRIGWVTGKAIDDREWAPLVPKSKRWKQGQMGCRVLVRWDLTVGPYDRDIVVALPEEHRLARNEMLPTIAEIRSLTAVHLKRCMNDERNWVGLESHFAYERALSEFIAAYPYRLKDARGR
jgi:hypothetical protein